MDVYATAIANISRNRDCSQMHERGSLPRPPALQTFESDYDLVNPQGDSRVAGRGLPSLSSSA